MSDITEVTERSINERARDFSDLLQNIESLSDKKRQLWREIYENALADRQNAYVVFAQLFKLSDSKSTELAVHGRTLTACIERMSKANEQLIKLAELVARAENGNESIDPDEMFAQINKGRS